jgi:hypothetical protein
LLLILCDKFRDNRDQRIVVSTSYRSGGFSSEEALVVPFISHLMMSWTLIDYLAARNANVLFSDLTVDELGEYYCYAGGSLRLMLMQDVFEIKSFLDEKIAKVEEPRQLASFRAFGKCSETFINASMQLK